MAERRASPDRRRQAEAEHTLPHNLEAERAVIGTVLVNNAAFEVASSILRSDQFYRDSHQRVWKAMATLIERAVDIDFVTLTEELARSGDLDEVGGPAAVGGLANGVPKSTNVRFYANIVREKAELRELIRAANTVLVSAYDGQETPTAILAGADREFLKLRRGYDRGRLTTLAETSAKRFQELEWRVAHRGALRGLDTGFQSLNDITLGWRGGDLIIIAARPSMGKTTFALNSFVHTAATPHFRDTSRRPNLAVFSLEMKSPQLEDRILSQISRLALSRIQGGFLNGPDWPIISNALSTMHDLNIAIDDRTSLNANDIWTSCRRHIAEHGVLDGVLVDYIQLMTGLGLRKGATRSEEIGDNVSSLKDLGGEFDIPVIVVSQLTRVDGRPKLENLRESGTLEQVADIVGMLYRKDHKVSGTTELIIAKQRNGATGTLNLTLDRDTTTFMDGGEPIPEPTPEEKKADGKRKRGRMVGAMRAREQDAG